MTTRIHYVPADRPAAYVSADWPWCLMIRVAHPVTDEPIYIPRPVGVALEAAVADWWRTAKLGLPFVDV